MAGLARFFPDASPVRMPVQLARIVSGSDSSGDQNASSAHSGTHSTSYVSAQLGAHFSESVVIEFGTPREVLFACHTPLEFGDELRLRNSDSSFDVVAWVVAVQSQPGNTVVAARFRGEVPNWIVKS